ncbi:hypothetical protein BC829DRAFT_74775 [Chytridium lagenaria]|nr:hypothetical protein BC829DRAFT_74775 [Chytridium lagenaria]
MTVRKRMSRLIFWTGDLPLYSHPIQLFVIEKAGNISVSGIRGDVVASTGAEVMTDGSTNGTIFNVCNTDLLLLECAYLQPGFAFCVNVILGWSVMAVVLGFVLYVSSWRLRKLQTILEKKVAGRNGPKMAKLGTAMEWALLCFFLTTLPSFASFVYLELGMRASGYFQLMTSLRNICLVFGALLYIDMILSMNFYITETLMEKPAFLLTPTRQPKAFAKI